MALIDLNSPGPAFDPARLAKTFRDTAAIPSTVPYEALDRLGALHQEASRDMALARFLARSPLLCLALMVIGASTLIWASRAGATLEAEFTWAAMVLIGIVAMTGNAIEGQARNPQLVPLQKAAWKLRMLLLYTGTAWGTGGFLMLPGAAAPALAFAVAPSLACALILRDEKAVIGFIAPATLATATAVLLGTWPTGAWVAGTILIAGAAIAGLVMLQCAMHRRHNSLPVPALR
jgi:hypothetical protein